MRRKFDLSIVTSALKDRVGLVGASIGESTGSGLKERASLYPHIDQETRVMDPYMRIIYAAPQFCMLPAITLLSVYAFTFYEDLGGSALVASFFVATARCLDVIVTPYLSYLSDHLKSSYGRRKPLIFIGCWIYVFFLLMVCTPPTSLNSVELTAWFAVSYIGFFLSYSFISVPYDALGPELTDSYDERTSLFWTCGMFEGLGTIVGIILPGFLAVTVNLDSLTFSCSNKSCYNPDGFGKSCLADPRTDKVQRFHLFDPNTFASDTSCNPEGLIDPSELFVERSCYGLEDRTDCMTSFCNCINNCETLCVNNSRRLAFRWVAGVFSLWVVFSFSTLVWKLKERGKTKTQESYIPPPILPSIFSLFHNRAFTTLLPAWTLESVAFNLITSMMVYFVRYVIKPEFQTANSKLGINCNNGIPIKGEESDSWQCKSNLIVGAIITAMCISAFVFCPVWLYLVKKYGKRDVWLGWSAFYALCMVLFLSVGEGDVILAISLGFFAGIPLGAKFISDAIVSDIIDYDEFLTGQRNEAAFTMFKSFIPKLVSIPAGSLPIAILNAVGHKAPVGGHIQKQPKNIEVYCIMMTVVVPTILCLFAIVVKTRYPFKTKETIENIREGIGKQLEGKSSKDPITKLEYIYPKFTKEETFLVHNLAHFPSLLDAECYKLCLVNNRIDVMYDILFSRVREHLAICLITMVLCLVITIITYPLIDSPGLFIIPTFTVIALGLTILVFTFQMFRFYAIRSLKFKEKNNHFTKELLTKIISYRRRVAVINGIQTFKIFRIVDSDETFNEWAMKRIGRLYRKYLKWHAKFFHNIDDEDDEEEEEEEYIGGQSMDKILDDDEEEEVVEKKEKVEVVEEIIEMGIFSQSHEKKINVELERQELYKDAYNIWFEVNNLGCFSEIPMPRGDSKVGADITVWDHELYSFLLEMGKINAYFQKLRLKKMKNKSSNSANKNKSSKSNRRDNDSDTDSMSDNEDRDKFY